MNRSDFCILVLCLVLVAALFGCSGPTDGTTTRTTPPRIQPIIAPHHAHRVITYCPAITQQYPMLYFRQANRLMAFLIDQATTVNQDGLSVFVNYINANSYLPESTPLIIQVPALPADPNPPVLTLPKPTGNPFADGQAKAKAKQDYQQAMDAYQATLAKLHAHLASVQQQVKEQTNVLRQLPADPTAQVPTTIVGCLARAGDHDSAEAGEHWTIIASDILGDSDAGYHSIPALAGSHILFIFSYCAVDMDCSTEQTEIQSELLHDGVKVVKFYDPAVSADIQSLF